MEEAEETPAKAPKTPATPKAQSTGGGSRKLFAGNLAFSIDKPDVIEFFKQCGPIADIRFSSDEDGRFKGFGHVEFETEEGAHKAVKLNGKELCGRHDKLDFSRERGDRGDRGAFTPQSGGYQKPEGRTIYIRGFDISMDVTRFRANWKRISVLAGISQGCLFLKIMTLVLPRELPTSSFLMPKLSTRLLI